MSNRSVRGRGKHCNIIITMVLKALWIAHAALVIVGRASAATTDCHPAHVSGRAYANGEWASASITATTPITFINCSPPGIGDCPASGLKTEGGFNHSEIYNFQCTSDSGMCSHDMYAPGSINSELAWTRESSPCSSVSSVFR
jgi:hypothetical protein